MTLKGLIYGFGALLYRLVLALGLGGTVMFILFAPILFSVLPEAVPDGRHLSGVIVNKTLFFVQLWGMGGGALLLLLGAALYWKRDRSWQRIGRISASALIAILSAVSMFVVAASMNELREAMGVIDQIPLDDVRRVTFNQYHRISSTLHLVILLSNIFLLSLPLPGSLPRRDATQGLADVVG